MHLSQKRVKICSMTQMVHHDLAPSHISLTLSPCSLLLYFFEFSSHCEHFFLRTHYSCFSLGAFTLTLHSAPPNSYDLLPHFPTLHSRRFNLLLYLEDGVLLNHPLLPFYIFFSEFDKEIKFKVFQVETGRIKILL